MSAPLILGYPVIDSLHEEMATLLVAATSAPDSDLLDTLTRLRLHTEHHFAQEESLMRDHHFAGLNEHRREHQQLLAELNGMTKAVTRGRFRLARAWLNDRLPEWFHFHVSNLDGLLVAYLNRNRG